MESLTIYPENQKQLSLLKNLLEEMHIQFLPGDTLEDLSDWQKELIDQGINDVEMGKTVSNQDVQDKAKALCSRLNKQNPANIFKP